MTDVVFATTEFHQWLIIGVEENHLSKQLNLVLSWLYEQTFQTSVCFHIIHSYRVSVEQPLNVAAECQCSFLYF